MNLFYSPNIIEPITILTEEESKHIIRVLRKAAGDIIYFTDGNGFKYNGKIIDANPKKCIIEIFNKKEGDDKRNYTLHIGIAPTKNIARFEWFLEKCTEIGIDSITPIICDHSERRDIKPERLNKVITSAMKQSLKSFHPELNYKKKFQELISENIEGDKFIAYIDNEVTLELKEAYTPGSNVTILIGPEGDFSPEEVEIAKTYGYIPVRLGKSRLRTETAGIVACHTITLANL